MKLMASFIHTAIEAPPKTVKVLVDFYDEIEKKAFLSNPFSDRLKELPTTLEIPTADLCTYYLYYKRRDGIPGFSNHEDIAKKWHHALYEFDGQTTFVDGTVRLLQSQGTDGGVIEGIGESIGLAVPSDLHNLSNADWLRVPESNRKKTLDFWHPWTASDGRRFVQVENKGSGPVDGDYKSSSISKHKASIKAKKSEATDDEKKSSILYGTIGVISEQGIARCWLVDPPPNVPDDPLRFQIIARIEFTARLVSFIAGRSTLASALQTRLAALKALTSISELDGIPIRKGNGEPFSSEVFDFGRDHNPWLAGKSVVHDKPVGGQLIPVDRSGIFFFGLREELVASAVLQSFDLARTLSFEPAITDELIDCVVPSGRFRNSFERLYNIPTQERFESGGYVRFQMASRLIQSTAGLVFGVLEVPESWQLPSGELFPK
ncbi:MAG: hypothetical protein C0483_04780 [Pirellula sp.]|nr:hypothetical protein [Pirellula sp.]